MGPAIPIWLDCDPGHDDATAILLAGHSPGLRLLGVSTIGGNQTLAKVTMNALDVLDAIGLSHIAVVAGQPRPLTRAPLLCPEVHGDSGLDGPGGGRLLPRSPRAPLLGKAVNVMYGAIAAAYEDLHRGRAAATIAAAASSGSDVDAGSGRPVSKVRLVCTGALTNAALLLTVYPEVTQWLEVSLMGGCMGVGNTGPVMEFNIQTDPEAAKIVFESGVPITMVPLEVTHTVLVTPQVLAAIGGGGGDATAVAAAGADAPPAPAAAPAPAPLPAAAPCLAAVSPFRHTIQQLLLFFADTYKQVFRFEHPPLHDPVAVAYVVRPDLFECRRMRVDVETCSSLSYGQTVCDVWSQSGRPPNVNVALRVDVAGFWELLLAAIGRADAVSPLNAADGSATAAVPAAAAPPLCGAVASLPDGAVPSAAAVGLGMGARLAHQQQQTEQQSVQQEEEQRRQQQSLDMPECSELSSGIAGCCLGNGDGPERVVLIS